MFQPNADVIRRLPTFLPRIEQWRLEKPRYLDRDQPDWETKLEKSAQFNRYYQDWTRDFRTLKPLDVTKLTHEVKYGYHEFISYTSYHLFLRKEKEENRYPSADLLEVLHALHNAGLLRGLPDYRTQWETEADPYFKAVEESVQTMDMELLSRFLSASLFNKVYSFPIQKGILEAVIRRAVILVS